MFKSNSILLAACGGSALLALSCGSVASAAVIYTDPLTGYASGTNLNGLTPGPVGNTNKWLAPTSSNEWLSVGTSGVNANGGNANAILAFTPVAGNIYTLQATVAVAGNTSNWGALGFLTSDTNTTATTTFFGSSSSWMLARGANGGEDQTFVGPGTGGLTNVTTVGTNDSVTMTLTLTDNGTSPWTIGYKYTDLGNSSNDSTYSPVAYSSNPTNIAAVGFGESAANVTVTNFSLTSNPIPEPATLGLVAVGALGLLLLKRRKASV
ncbi:MAG: PEP-CTERM sorting domain-containing protein [Planctomycetia bacterium]|nr:PEP-CTERM sorting domain-containing protein [Planctomycetia bacterium]